MALECGDVGQNGDMRVFGKVGGRRRAGRDGEKVDAGILGGFGVDIAVAGVEDVGFFDAEMLNGTQQARGLGLVALDVVAADNQVDELGDMVDVKFFLNAAVRLVGDDADFGAGCLDGAQSFYGTGEEGRTGRHVAVGLKPVVVEEMTRFVVIFCRNDDFCGIDDGQADGFLDAFVRSIFVAEFLERDMETFDNGRFGIDERVVKVKEIKAVIHK